MSISLSLIIPIHPPGLRFLAKNVESILIEKIPNLQLIAVLDRVSQIEIEGIFPIPTLFVECPKPGSIALARNIGVKKAQGEYTVFHDSDDLMAKGGLIQRLKVAKMDPRSWLMGELSGFINEAGEEIEIDLPEDKTGIPLFGLVRSIFRTNEFSQWGGFDESLQVADDREFIIRALRKNPLEVADLPTVFHRFHGNNTSTKLIRNRPVLRRVAQAENWIVDRQIL